MRAADKILTAVAVLALGGGGLTLHRLLRKRDRALAGGGASAALPVIALPPGAAGKVTKIELGEPDDQAPSGSPRTLAITIERRGGGWELTTPIGTEASTPKVEALLGNLETLRLWKQLDSTARYYERYDLTDGKPLHVVAWQGPNKVVDFFCGKSSLEGQLVRLPDRDGLYALINWGTDGYAGFLYTRSLRSWRETSIFGFDPARAIGIEIRNRNGVFQFHKLDGKWTAARQIRRGDGRLDSPARAWPRFDAARIESLLRDLHALSADDFGDGVDRRDAGVDDAERTGGVLRIELERPASTLTLRVGRPAATNTRWAIKDSRWAVKDGGDGTLYALSPYTAGWAVAAAAKFE